MTFMRHFVVSLCVVFVLVSCGGSGDPGLQATIDAQSTRLATVDSDVTTPEGERTETVEAAEATRLTGTLLPGETWKKGETEMTLSHTTFEPGCSGVFGFQLDVADRSGGILNGEDIAIYDESDRLFSNVWWKSGSPSEQCYDSTLDHLLWNSASKPTITISFRVLGTPDRGVSRVEVTPPDPSLGTAVWELSALTAENLQTETAATEESAGTTNWPTPTPEESLDNRPALLWSSAGEDFKVSDGMAFFKLQDGRVQARKLESGNVVWESQAKYERLLTADSDNVYVIPSWQRIDALNAATGEDNWTALLPAAIDDSLGLLGYAQTASDLFVYLEDSGSQSMYGIKIARIDKNSGLVELLPFRRRAGWLDVVGDGVLVVDREIGWSPSTRGVLWDVSDIAGEKSLCNDLLVFYSKDGLSALEITSGDTRWTVEVPHRARDIYCKPTVGPYLEEESDRIYVRTRYSYDEAGPLVTVDKQTGEIMIGLESNTDFTVGGEYTWLGEVEDMLVYSHEGFGVTEAYDEDHTTLLWQNKEVVLWEILGVLDDKLIGMVWEQKDGTGYPKILAALDLASGKEHWRTEIGRHKWPGISNARLISGRLLYYNNDDEIVFVDPASGSIDTILSPGPVKYQWSGFFAIDGMIASWTIDRIAVIAP